MAMKITYENGATEILPEAVRVDPQNFHEGMYDFYDENSNLLKQISMFEKFSWEVLESSDSEKGS
ncbi:MAG TPA: hypothetical protein VNB22_00540 [Pyrinomonadaceae bacterium]|nr:hypothetical protein [Pyrinomonadaceae bacterium]